jgi:hypothetical protein
MYGYIRPRFSVSLRRLAVQMDGRQVLPIEFGILPPMASLLAWQGSLGAG